MSMDDQPAYLEHEAFQTCNAGPWIDSDMHHHGRDPAPEQILERAAVIRRHHPRKPVCGRVAWSVAVVAETDLSSLDVQASDLMERTA